MNVLVIDDEKDIRDNIASILKKHGHHPTTTDNVKTALELINAKKWDMIISDVMIPHLGGFELVEAAKKVAPNTPVIIITGMDKNILKATVSHADTILTKPFTAKQLMEAVEKFVKI